MGHGRFDNDSRQFDRGSDGARDLAAGQVRWSARRPVLKVAKRIDLAYAGLTERAVDLLRRLQTATDTLLGAAGGFDPDAALADPAPLAKITSNFHRTIKVRRRLPRRFNTLVSIAIAAPTLAGVYVLGAWGAAAHYADWLDFHWLPEAGFIAAGIAMVGGLFLVLAYFYLEWKLTTADIMSQAANSPAKRKGR